MILIFLLGNKTVLRELNDLIKEPPKTLIRAIEGYSYSFDLLYSYRYSHEENRYYVVYGSLSPLKHMEEISLWDIPY